MIPSSCHVRILDVIAPPSEQLLRACAAFGLAVRHAPHRADAGRPERRTEASAILRALKPGQVALVTGPSGGGKSSLLNDIHQQARACGERVMVLPDPPAGEPLIDVLRLPLAESLRALARAGLAEAMLLGRSAAQLSEGERFRLRLALAMGACGGRRPVTLVIDEFASTLDRTTARCLCLAMRRWILGLKRAGPDVRIVTATAHHDVAPWLAPELIAVVPLGGAPVELTRMPAEQLGAPLPTPARLRRTG